MVYNIDWIFPSLKQPYRIWNVASSFTIAAVGLFSKIIAEWLNTTNVYNKDVIEKAIDNRPHDVPLITVSNHYSCFDDPGLWGALKLQHVCSRRKMRWSVAAHDICFTNKFHSYFFMLGKCIPVVRGKGVYQDALDFCIHQLGQGEWIHMFPEGRVNMTKEFLRIKWGVGRLVYESPIVPLVIPMWHVGMDQILPNEPPYYIRTRNRVTLNYGKPIDFGPVISQLRARCASPEEARKTITDRIQEELMALKVETEKLHLVTLAS